MPRGPPSPFKFDEKPLSSRRHFEETVPPQLYADEDEGPVLSVLPDLPPQPSVYTIPPPLANAHDETTASQTVLVIDGAPSPPPPPGSIGDSECGRQPSSSPSSSSSSDSWHSFPSMSTQSIEIRPLKVLVASSCFPMNGLSASEVADCISDGINSIFPSYVDKVSLHDGGHGFTHAFIKAQGGTVINVPVHGPYMEPIEAPLGIWGESREYAVLDVASIVGLQLIDPERRDLVQTTSYGVGEMIKEALNKRCTKIMVGCGDSGTCDGGMGMLQALGVRLLDEHGNELPRGACGAMLGSLDRVDFENAHPALKRVQIECVCNPRTWLTGPFSSAASQARSKAPMSESTYVELRSAFNHYREVVARTTGIDWIDLTQYLGAAGGIAAGLLLVGAEMKARFEVFQQYFNRPASMMDGFTDVVIVAEESLYQSMHEGKMGCDISELAMCKDIPVIALTLDMKIGSGRVYSGGLCGCVGILKSHTPSARRLECAIKDAAMSAISIFMFQSVGLQTANIFSR